MAKEYIEREAATAYAPLPKHLREYQTMNLDDAWEDGYDFAIRQLNSIPAADVAPVRHGKWIKCKMSAWGYRQWYECSKCGEPCFPSYGHPARTNFCHNCGAQMDADMREVADG